MIDRLWTIMKRGFLFVCFHVKCFGFNETSICLLSSWMCSTVIIWHHCWWGQSEYTKPLSWERRLLIAWVLDSLKRRYLDWKAIFHCCIWSSHCPRLIAGGNATICLRSYVWISKCRDEKEEGRTKKENKCCSKTEMSMKTASLHAQISVS